MNDYLTRQRTATQVAELLGVEEAAARSLLIRLTCEHVIIMGEPSDGSATWWVRR